MIQQIIFTLLCFTSFGCYTIINPPMMSESPTFEQNKVDSSSDSDYEYDVIDDSSIIIEGDYVNVYNSSHSCGHYNYNRYSHNNYSYSWWWSDHSYCSFSMNYYDWYFWDHHHHHYDNYHNGNNWNSNDYSYSPTKKKRRNHSFGRDALANPNNQGDNLGADTEYLAIDKKKSKKKDLLDFSGLAIGSIKENPNKSKNNLRDKNYKKSKKNKNKESFSFGKVIGELIKKQSSESIDNKKKKKSNKKTRNMHKRKKL